MALKTLFVSAALGATLLAAAPAANATTYTGVQDIDGEIVDLSFTTDGALGNISTSDIVAFNIAASGSVGNFDINSLSGELDDPLGYQTITASLTGLTTTIPNVGPYDGFLIATGELHDGLTPFFCVGGDCGDGVLPFPFSGESVGQNNTYENVALAAVPYPAGTIVTLGTVSAAPEPSTWALMIAGDEAAGGMMRTRERRQGFATA